MGKQTKEKLMEKQEIDTQQIEFNRIGTGLRIQLNKHFEQWSAGLPYKTIMSPLSSKARLFSISLDELSEFLENNNFIKVRRTPQGKRFVFSGDCPLTNEELNNWVQDQEIQKEAEKEFKKANKA